jgi:hypothetical protein
LYLEAGQTLLHLFLNRGLAKHGRLKLSLECR